MNTYQEIIDFGFAKETKALWFNSTDDFDLLLREKYFAMYNAAKNSELSSWQKTALAALALVIILDQFPLNMFRGLPQSFETEALARDVARRAISNSFDAALSNEQKEFLYLPFMLSEN